MSWDRIRGNWKEIGGEIQERWGRLTDDDPKVVAGRRERLVARLQELYGIQEADAEEQLLEVERRLEAELEVRTPAESVVPR